MQLLERGGLPQLGHGVNLTKAGAAWSGAALSGLREDGLSSPDGS